MVHALDAEMHSDGDEVEEYQEDFSTFRTWKRKKVFLQKASIITEEDEFLARILLHLSGGLANDNEEAEFMEDSSNDEEAPPQIEHKRKAIKVKRSGGLKDVRLPNACEVCCGAVKVWPS